ncbi:MAG: hypothetical protein NWE89_02755 [Candidatus Bathyarchaeota archaeon]|nr:hypothetical protein [Candidatus Bathyarchaeota archaeon]
MLRTTSQVLSLHSHIEEKQAKQYSELAKRSPKHLEVFNRLAKENIRHRDMALRAYREGVTDAFEVGFLAKPLNPEEYVIEDHGNELKDALNTSLRNEETVIRFCLDVASSSSELIPDLPETFERLVKRKNRRVVQLKEILDEL